MAPTSIPTSGKNTNGVRGPARAGRRAVAALLVLVPACFGLGRGNGTALAAEPRVLLAGCRLELIASEPAIVTPIGLAFDGQGRLLVVESHTHQRQEEYAGPAGDRIRAFADSDCDGRLDAWSTLAEGFEQAMNVCAGSEGGVYLVTRRDVRLLEDADGDGRAERQTTVLQLQTDVDYPHNGLSGIAFVANGPARSQLYIGLGENFGGAYRLIGSDGSEVADHGGAGTIFTCDPAGGKLARYATGFWNPFSLCEHGSSLFCVDNDPDASPPCRLIEALPAGDYGHRWAYGRAGTHPLQAWNGELPGTLPMVCGTGEAPTAVLSHGGYLWVTSWGDHRIERYSLVLNADGHYGATLTTIVQGDDDFRPTGMTLAPDGSLYFGDWVRRDYAVHGCGRIWRLTLPNGGAAPPESGDYKRRAQVETQRSIASAAGEVGPLPIGDGADESSRLARLQALRWRRGPAPEVVLRQALKDPAAAVRLYAVRWIADERLLSLRDEVGDLLDGEISDERYFLAVLGAVEWLEGEGDARSADISDRLLVQELEQDSRPPEFQALALRLLAPDHQWLTIARLEGYSQSPSPAVRLEAVRSLAQREGDDRWPLLLKLATDESLDDSLRAEVVAGFAADVAKHQGLLARLAQTASPAVAAEAARILRLGQATTVDEHAPAATDLPAWNRLLAAGGDAESGRRLFHLAVGPRCAACHCHGGRGGSFGPELTRIGRDRSREAIIASILQPSREVAPHYQPWTLLTHEGKSLLGLRLPKGGDDGVEVYTDVEGREFKLASSVIALRQPSEKSIMPDGLERTMSVADLRDLVAFLAGE